MSTLVVVSCKKELTKVIEKYDDGTVKGYYFIDKDSLRQGERIIYHKNGKVFSKTSYLNDKRNDSIFFYYDNLSNSIEIIEFKNDDGSIYYKDFNENGKINKIGVLDGKDRKIKKWKYYTKEGTLDFIKEYKIIRGESYTNQLWLMLPGGDTIREGTSMKYKVHPRKVKLGDSIRFFFQSDVPAFKFKEKQGDFLVILPKDYTKENFDAEFYNQESSTQNGIPTQRILSLKYNTKYPAEKTKIDTADHKKTVVFYLKPKRLGKDTIRGYFNEVATVMSEEHNLYEFRDKTIKDKDTVVVLDTRTIYFDIPIEVLLR
ncbi:toxin-antitoxin system YwqK family antitoxin [Aquimarina longa]|uniref:toxin-antitoxin system YwqK family antitoxin n=1 Tax=Aquimarina longa TaxID=1080221 RepID=UPI0007811F74|nr:hypothetical protein [Aquimarina longa]